MSNRKEKPKVNLTRPIQAELALLEVIWNVAKDNFNDYFASRADVHRLNVATAMNKPDAESDRVYA